MLRLFYFLPQLSCLQNLFQKIQLNLCCMPALRPVLAPLIIPLGLSLNLRRWCRNYLQPDSQRHFPLFPSVLCCGHIKLPIPPHVCHLLCLIPCLIPCFFAWMLITLSGIFFLFFPAWKVLTFFFVVDNFTNFLQYQFKVACNTSSHHPSIVACSVLFCFLPVFFFLLFLF